MNIEHMHEINDRSVNAYDDLRAAVRTHAFVQAKDGVTIIASERTGARERWIFDFRALMLQPHWLNRYADIFWERYAGKLPFQVGGLETAGIPLVAAIVMKGVERGTPVNGFYLRKSRKRQGLMKQIEGTLTHEPIIFVDDLLNSGQSVNRNLEVLERAGKQVSDVFVMLAFRAPEAYSFLSKRDVSLCHLFTLVDFGEPLLSAQSPALPHDSFQVVWRYEAPNPSFHLVVQKSAPVLDDMRLYFGCDDGTFRALDLATGSLTWKHETGRHPIGKGILSSPTLYDGTVYFGAYDGGVYALDSATGTQRWKYTDADWVGSSPDLAPNLNLLFVGLEYGLFRRRGGVAALDMLTGTEKWRAYHPELTHGSPLFIKNESLVVIGSNDGTLYAYDASSGVARWRYWARGDIKTRPAYDARRRRVIVNSMNGCVYALDARCGEPAAAYETNEGLYSTPLVHNDVIYVSSLDKHLYALDAETLRPTATFETNGRVFASPMYADRSLWIGSNDGRLYELDPASLSLRTFHQFTERIVCPVRYDTTHNRLLVPTVANEIYCITRTDRSREKQS